MGKEGARQCLSQEKNVHHHTAASDRVVPHQGQGGHHIANPIHGSKVQRRSTTPAGKNEVCGKKKIINFHTK
jgi:hypothetical protein